MTFFGRKYLNGIFINLQLCQLPNYMYKERCYWSIFYSKIYDDLLLSCFILCCNSVLNTSWFMAKLGHGPVMITSFSAC